MRPSLLILLVPAVLACAKSDDAAVPDTSSAAAAAASALQPSDISGAWDGMTMAQDGDSVLSRWTLISTSDSTGMLVLDASKDTVKFQTEFHGDSMTAVSEPYESTLAANAPMVVFNSTGRMQDGKLVGTVIHKLASNTDSVVGRARWEAIRAP